MEMNEGMDLSNLPACYSKKKTRKCSSCKCMKPMDQFMPITINKKTVIPKTCQYCRSRRNNYYWNFETKKAKTEGIESIPQPMLVPLQPSFIPMLTPITTPSHELYPSHALPVDLSGYAMPSTQNYKRELPLASEISPLIASVETYMPMEPVVDLEVDLHKRADELSSMHDFDQITKHTVNEIENELPDSVDVNDLILELQRQTVQNMMEELATISDILAASQLDAYNNNELELPLFDDLESFQLQLDNFY